MPRPPELVAAVAPHAPPSPTASPLLVVVHDIADLDGPLVDAAGRAGAEGRALLVSVVIPARPLTIDAVVHAMHARLVAELEAAMTAAVHQRTGPRVPVLLVPRSRGRTARTHRRLARRVASLARLHGAEVHPGGPVGQPSGQRLLTGAGDGAR